MCKRWKNVLVWYNRYKKRNEQLFRLKVYQTKNPFPLGKYNTTGNDRCQSEYSKINVNKKISDDDTEQMQELAFDETLAGKSDSVYNIISVRCESIGRYRTC